MVGLLAMLILPATASASPSNLLQGRAFDLSAKLSPLGAKVVIGPDTGQISTNMSSSTVLSAAHLSTTIGDASALNASVTTNAQTETSTASASIALASIHITGLPTIGAGVITANSTTSCRNGRTSSGSSVGGTVTVNGTTYPIASPPNTVIPLGPVGSITLNQQTAIPNGLTVNAVHIVSVSLGVDVVISSASSAVTNCA